MELKTIKEAFLRNIKKDKAVMAILFLGICGIMLVYLSTVFHSDADKEKTDSKMEERGISENYGRELEDRLEKVIKAITGEDDPVVMLTLENNGRHIYASDEKRNTQSDTGGASEERQNSEEKQTDHIILKDANGTQHALTVTEIQPKVKGVVVVSRYAANPAIREKLTEAVCTVLDVSFAKVCVTSSG